MAGDPIKHVEAWLERQGYPLEYRVARLLRAEGSLEVEQGRYWVDVDPIAGRKARELDVVGTLRGSKAMVHLVIECKHIPEPWVIFEHENAQTGPFDQTVDRLMANKAARDVLRGWYRSSRAPWHLRPSAAFKVVDARAPRAKGAPKPSDETAAFDASMALSRGAWAIHQSTPPGLAVVTLLALVVEGDLVTLSYDSTGKRKLARTEFEWVTWSAAVLQGPGDYIRPEPITIDVLLTAMLDNYVDKAARSARDIFRTLEAKL